ncbi:hypothetical protein [uncultured Chitinophaga sp.]|uniref:hypothetical protein n=1 Tax=uncultured Chitinophaga sp. TaxID=339340 RepID=UPI0025EF17D3|nr:hypothetical protein [uncultured Chitinophaga sp.]
MATYIQNTITYGLTGKCGQNHYFRQQHGKTVLCTIERPYQGPATVKQQAANNQFRKAQLFAKQVIADPERKAAYTSRAREGCSAYNMAISDAMQAPVIKNVETEHRTIRVTAIDNFAVTAVTIAVYDETGELVEHGVAEVPTRKLHWEYEVNTSYAARVVIKAFDGAGNFAEQETHLPNIVPTVEECDATADEQDLLRRVPPHFHYFNICPKVVLNERLRVKPNGNFAFYTQENKINRYEKDRHNDDGRRDVGVGGLLQQYEGYLFLERRQQWQPEHPQQSAGNGAGGTKGRIVTQQYGKRNGAGASRKGLQRRIGLPGVWTTGVP